MRILMYATYFPPHYSGAAKQAIALAKQLKNKGHHIEFITVRRPNEAIKDHHEGFKVWRIKMGQGKHQELHFWWNFFKFLYKRKNDFDILHSHGAYYFNSVIGPLGRLFGMKSVIKTSLANNDLAGAGHGLSGRLHLFFLKQIDAYIAISRELQKEFKALNLPAAKIFFFPNGVDTHRFFPLPTAAKNKKKKALNLPPRRPIALNVGVLGKRKNIGWLIKEWINNNGFDTGALLLAIGPQSREDEDGSFFDSLNNMVKENSTLVQILGHTNAIENYFQAADFFILPSQNEGMPNVVLEAMAAGLPCITTAVSGCTDLIREGKNGFIFSPTEENSLQHALQQLFASSRDELENSARKKVERQFSLSSLSGKYESLYSHLCYRTQ